MNRMYHALRKLFRQGKNTRRAASPAQSSLHVEVLEDRVVPAANSDFRGLIGLDTVQALYPYRGTGYTVAVLDTGINYNLSSLGGGIGPGHRVLYGYNFLNNTTNALDDNGHGTFLAGEIGNSDPNLPGIAPSVQFVDLKVLDSNMNGSWTAIDNALKWVIQNQQAYNIVALNLSFGSGNYLTDSFTTLETEFTTLKNMGVFTAVASGNNFAVYNSQPGLAYPAVDPDVVSVGATWAGSYGSQTFNGATDYATAPNQIASYGQRDSNLSIMAPGSWLSSLSMSGGTQLMGGTSMSTAVVSGSAALLHQALDQTGQSSQATEAGILQLMRSTGYTLVDNATNNNVHATGLTYKSLNLAAAMNAVVHPTNAPTITPIANQTMQVGQTINVAVPVSYPAGLPVTLSYQLAYLPALAYQLKLQYGLTSTGNYYTNGSLADEKWIAGSGSTWYWLMPNGDLRRWAGSTPATLQASNLLATLDPSYYVDPTKLWNAAPASNPPAALSLSGNTLSIRSSGTWVGTYGVVVKATDGVHTAKQTFNVTVSNSPPTLAAVAPQTMATGQTSSTLTLAASDPGNNPLTFQAVAQTPSAIAYQLNQQYSFQQYGGSYYTNTWGYNEKWLFGINNQWYALMPNGQLYRWAQSVTATLQPANLIATLDPSFYNEPRLLWYAQPAVTPPLTFSFVGNQLTIQRSASLTGVFFIDVIVSDGLTTTKITIQVTLN